MAVFAAFGRLDHFYRRNLNETFSPFDAVPAGTRVSGVPHAEGLSPLHTACWTGMWWDGSPVSAASCPAVRLGVIFDGFRMTALRAYRIERAFSTPDVVAYAAGLVQSDPHFAASIAGAGLAELLLHVAKDQRNVVPFPQPDSTVQP